jgi:hypothetical protein
MDLPIKGNYTVNGHDILVVGLVAGSPVDGHPKISVVFVDQDGSMGQCALSEVNVNWRFNDRSRRWIDVDTGDDLEGDSGDGEN